MSHKIIKPEGIELIEFLGYGFAICDRCGAVMGQTGDPGTGCGVYVCPSCGFKVDVGDDEFESGGEVVLVGWSCSLWIREIFRQPDAEPAEDLTRIAVRHVSYLMTKNIIERRSMLWHRLFLFGE